MPVKVLLREHTFRHGAGIIDPRTHQGSVGHGRIVSRSRTELTGGQPRDRRGEGVQEQLVDIETMAVLGLIRAIHAIRIELARANALNPHVPHVTRAVACGIQIITLVAVASSG